MIRMDEAHKIRKAYREGSTINEIAVRFNRSWETIKNSIEKSPKELRNREKRPKRQRRVITSMVIEAIDSYLNEELEKGVWKKQRYTAAVIFKDLTAKWIYRGSRRQLQDTVKKSREKRAQLKPKTYLVGPEKGIFSP